jgi:DNA-binding transcriptional MerR regulator
MHDETPAIPDKLYFKIGEVSEIVGVEPYVLRYWESEFPGLSPKKSSTGQRQFRRKDVELLLDIKKLLYEKKFTIEGARKALKGQEELFPAPDPLPGIRQELAAILKLLS